MRTSKLIDAQLLALTKHYNHPLMRRRFALFLGEERRMALLAEMEQVLVPVEYPGRLRESHEPEWAADNAHGEGYGPIGQYRGFYVFRAEDPHALHFQPMERIF